jgi:alpha-N-arabinofuranosidase
LQLFATHSRGKALNVFVDSPTYKTQKYAAVPYLDVSAAYDNGTLVLNVVNRNRDQAIEVEIQSQKGNFSGSFEVAEVNGPDIKAENTFVNQSPDNPKSISATESAAHQFPAHSYTMIKRHCVSSCRTLRVSSKGRLNASEEIHYDCESGSSWVDGGAAKARHRERTAE